LDQPLAVSQAFSLAKLCFLKVAVPKLKFWNRLCYIINHFKKNPAFPFPLKAGKNASKISAAAPGVCLAILFSSRTK
jgi:hypothetical protein